MDFPEFVLRTPVLESHLMKITAHDPIFAQASVNKHGDGGTLHEEGVMKMMEANGCLVVTRTDARRVLKTIREEGGGVATADALTRWSESVGGDRAMAM
mmetsp:Transcript_15276/g.38635  ORF Transcript_15276/g.38635 Transcript_15276/m.38635 type:complete len:99 (-) Transcript_15276:102-398(-)